MRFKNLYTEKTCRHCGSIFKTQKKDREYCLLPECLIVAKIRKCEWCGEEYTPTKTNQRGCCESHGNLIHAHKSKAAYDAKVDRVCALLDQKKIGTAIQRETGFGSSFVSSVIKQKYNGVPPLLAEIMQTAKSTQDPGDKWFDDCGGRGVVFTYAKGHGVALPIEWKKRATYTRPNIAKCIKAYRKHGQFIDAAASLNMTTGMVEIRCRKSGVFCRRYPRKEKTNKEWIRLGTSGRKTKLFRLESDLVKTCSDMLSSFAIAHVCEAVPKHQTRRIDIETAFHAIECKIDNHTPHVDQAIGQAMTRATLSGKSPVVCFPSDLKMLPETKTVLEKLNVLYCTEQTIGMVLSSNTSSGIDFGRDKELLKMSKRYSHKGAAYYQENKANIGQAIKAMHAGVGCHEAVSMGINKKAVAVAYGIKADWL